MPQFDKITFFNQVFWLIFLFSFFYFVLLKEFLPKIATILKLRTKKLVSGDFFKESSYKKIIKNYLKAIKFLISFLNIFRYSLVKILENYGSWLILIQKISAGKKNLQTLYLKSFSLVLPKKVS